MPAGYPFSGLFLKDMAKLPAIHPAVHDAFMEGKCVVQRDDKKFSLMALDQSQEHSIQYSKEDSGANGLYGQKEENISSSSQSQKC